MTANSVRGPSFCEYWRSFYYENSNTYLPGVDLRKKALAARNWLLPKESIPGVLHSPEVQYIFARQQLEGEHREQHAADCQRLTDLGFKLGSHEGIPCYCCTCSHPDIESSIMSAATPTIIPVMSDSGDHNASIGEDRILGLAFHERVKEIAKKAKIQVAVPQEKLVPLEHNELETHIAKRYCILTGKLEYTSREETISTIKNMTSSEQIALAKNLCFLIQEVGIASINLDRFRLTKDKQISFESFPFGLLASKESTTPQGASIEKCARIGLTEFVRDVRGAFGVTTEEGGDFRAHIEGVYEEAMRPKLSKWKITLSVLSLGIIPLICAIISLIQVQSIQGKISEFKRLLDGYTRDKESMSAEQRMGVGQQVVSLTDSIFSMMNGVPTQQQL